MISAERSPAKFGARGPLCALFFIAVSAGGAAAWYSMSSHHSSDFGGLATTGAADVKSTPHDAAVVQSETWSPRFRNNTQMCLEDALESQVLTWYAGRGGRICAEKVDVSGCDAELKLCAPLPRAADGSRMRRAVELGDECCGVLSVACRAYYSYAHRCEEMPASRL
jgi:hypothetical protein